MTDEKPRFNAFVVLEQAFAVLLAAILVWFISVYKADKTMETWILLHPNCMKLLWWMMVAGFGLPWAIAAWRWAYQMGQEIQRRNVEKQQAESAKRGAENERALDLLVWDCLDGHIDLADSEMPEGTPIRFALSAGSRDDFKRATAQIGFAQCTVKGHPQCLTRPLLASLPDGSAGYVCHYCRTPYARRPFSILNEEARQVLAVRMQETVKDPDRFKAELASRKKGTTA